MRGGFQSLPPELTLESTASSIAQGIVGPTAPGDGNTLRCKPSHRRQCYPRSMRSDVQLVHIETYSMSSKNVNGRNEKARKANISLDSHGYCWLPCEFRHPLPCYSKAITEIVDTLIGLQETLLEHMTCRLTKFVLKGHLRPGDDPLAEWELGRDFNVGRDAVREDLKAALLLGCFRSGAKGFLLWQTGRSFSWSQFLWA